MCRKVYSFIMLCAYQLAFTKKYEKSSDKLSKYFMWTNTLGCVLGFMRNKTNKE